MYFRKREDCIGLWKFSVKGFVKHTFGTKVWKREYNGKIYRLDRPACGEVD
jgi:hypothetical protein